MLTPDEEEELAGAVDHEVEDAARRAEAAPEATPEQAFDHVYARPLRPIPRAPAAAPPGLRPPAPPPRPTEGVERNVLETVRQTLDDLMRADERVVVLSVGERSPGEPPERPRTPRPLEDRPCGRR